jgi:hypothetical protein
MNWFKKSSPKDSASSSPKSNSPKMRFKWFTRSKAGATAENVATAMPQEIDIVPRTEISASRQALDNITLALSAHRGESSGESGLTRKCHESISKKGCENKYCCDVESHSHSPSADNEAIRNNHPATTKTSEQRKISFTLADDEVRHAFAVDDSKKKLEVPDPKEPSVVECPSINHPQVDDVKQRNYRIISDIEYKLEQSNFTLRQCSFFNHEYRKEYESLGSGCRPEWKLEDFNDDTKSTRMDEDTRVIKEFYRLSELNDILVHYHDIIIEASCTVECVREGFVGFVTWLVLKGKEMKEKHKVKEAKEGKQGTKCLWLRKLFQLFSKCKMRKRDEYFCLCKSV